MDTENLIKSLLKQHDGKMKPKPGMQDPRDTRDPSTLRTHEPPEFLKDLGLSGSLGHPGPLGTVSSLQLQY